MDIRYCKNWQEVMQMAIDYDETILICPVKGIHDPDFSEVGFAKLSGFSIGRLYELIRDTGDLIAIWIDPPKEPASQETHANRIEEVRYNERSL